MHGESLEAWSHDHTFGQDQVRPGESRTRWVLAITALMMVVEIAAGVAYGSMALLADGLHMGSHATALGIAAFTYWYARRHATSQRFSFGTGKVNALGGYTGAVLLAVFALMMAAESLERFLAPVPIQFDQALVVAVLGLLVNGGCALLLETGAGHHHGHGHSHEEHDHDHGEHHHGHGDHNLRSAYLHVLADALTSFFAIGALLAGKYQGAYWLDPAMGVVGSALVARWSWGLLRDTSGVLLDHQGPESVRTKIQEAIEADGDGKVADLHVWALGDSHFAGIVAVVAHEPLAAHEYKARIPAELRIAHLTVEVHRRA
jgi:cation diffusion facilitator family transporter